MPPRLSSSKPHYWTKMWIAVWKNLAEMQDLKLLDVELGIHEPFRSSWIANKDSIRESLMELRAGQFDSFSLRGLPFNLDVEKA